MRKIFSSCLFALILVCNHHSSAQQTSLLELAGKVLPGSGVAQASPDNRAAACAPASAIRDLEWNNIRALIETGGSMWQDRATGRASYFAPKSGDVSVLFAGALWMGGVSPDQQLKLAALLYRYSGNDYWTGPLSNDGSAEVTESTCQQWDNFVVSYRADAQRHRQYHECLADPTCDVDLLFPEGYTMPSYFENYPAHGQAAFSQDYYLSPFYDFDQSGDYDPTQGDYPWFDFTREIDCAQRRREDPIPLFGDQNFFWIFNDKGNVHSESGGQPIGMEVRAQAFAFSTNDEVNNMTFYNYVLINQGTQTLTETYFGTWIDLDIGGHVDDYVGCDVQRGLGYGYNGYAFDNPSSLSLGYGANPPAVGVDFFEGPYQDNDDIDNPLTTDINVAQELKGIPYKGIGIGYGDGIVDNERFGMRKFLYHISGAGNNGVPEQAVQYYNYLRGYWKNGQRMAYGGNALTSSSGADLSIEADFMFPGDTDPYNFGTMGVAAEPWTEVSSDNPPSDRRFMQSAGPFTLLPGDYNNITVGVVFARALSGEPFESVQLVRKADDKAQALFDNCFELISGPDAPEVTVQELENELILFLSNNNQLSNNYKEEYLMPDPTIPEQNSNNEPLTDLQRSYTFQGYMLYQLANADVSSSDLEDISKARLIAQCDVADGIGMLVNYVLDPVISQVIPLLKVQGADQGLQHSFRITEDAFASGNNRLINHKTYYFMCLAYGYNNYEPFNINTGGGQDETFIASRKAAFGKVPVINAIPHKVTPEAGGTTTHATYGQAIALTQTEGKGNATNFLNISALSEKEILQNNATNNLEFTAGNSPVSVIVVDPLRVPEADFDLKLAPQNQDLHSDTATWLLTNTTTGEVHNSMYSIQTFSDELVLNWGIAIKWNQYAIKDENLEHFTAFVGSSIVFDNPAEPWLTGVPDQDSYSPYNWIRSGSTWVSPESSPAEAVYNDYDDGPALPGGGYDVFTDPSQAYEGVVNGTWSPFCLAAGTSFNDDLQQWFNTTAPTSQDLDRDLSQTPHQYSSNIVGLNNVDVVLTDDKSKWTRCAVFEMQHDPILAQGNAEKMQMRKHPSLDKNGRTSGQPDCNEAEATLGGTQPEGMSWFPGYAIDIGTGQRLNMAFGEDSWQLSENGRDMIWNPTARYVSDIGAQYLFGGQHWIYVFRNMQQEYDTDGYMPRYDQGQFIYNLRDGAGILSQGDQKDIFGCCSWVGSAMLNQQHQLKSMANGIVPSGVRIKLRVAKPYAKYGTNVSDLENYTGATNWWNCRYSFTTRGLQANTNQQQALLSVLDCINIVPNPYYAFSSYESNKLDNRVKITNLPERCIVTIYDLNGVMIRQFNKADPLTSLDWDLKNHKNIPIASGTYIIHVNVPDVGEKILKWFGIMRPVDLDNF